jgi:hypothetical protein
MTSRSDLAPVLQLGVDSLAGAAPAGVRSVDVLLVA